MGISEGRKNGFNLSSAQNGYWKGLQSKGFQSKFFILEKKKKKTPKMESGGKGISQKQNKTKTQ